MKKIVIQNNFAYLYLNSNFYEKNSILNTIRIYSDFLKFNFKKIGNYYVVKMELIDNNFSISKLINEFINYLLSIEFELASKKEE